MASSKEFSDFIADQLSELDGITFRAMFGEYIIYFREKIIGGIYDDRLLVKPAKSAAALFARARYETPYEGAKPMLLVENTDDSAFLRELFLCLYAELPAPKPSKKRKSADRR